MPIDYKTNTGSDPRGYQKGSATDASTIDRMHGSEVGTEQLSPFFFYRKALIEIQKEQTFMQLADVRAMPKHFGKTIKQYHYLPLLDDRNVNDQGIDASGVAHATTGGFSRTIIITDPAGEMNYFEGQGDDAGGALTAAGVHGTAYAVGQGLTAANWTDASNALTSSTPPYKVEVAEAVPATGNLYGSSKDIGTISAKLPALSEFGGRVNRVGYSRKTIEGSIAKFGFFDEYTQESLDFDTDADLEMHVTREALRAANQMTEAALQIDLLNGANTIYPAGVTAANLKGAGGGMTAEGAAAADTIMTYQMLKQAEITLNNNSCPKKTTIITGSRKTDTRVLGACRVIYIGSEMQTVFEKMKDFHGNAAFIPVQQYADAGTLLNNEIGSVGNFRVVVAQEMLGDYGQGATATTNARGYATTNGRYNIYYGLIVGSGSFTTIGFQTDGKTVKFKVYHKRPGEGMVTRDDPYGELGLHSTKWYYGSMILRREWLIKLPSLGEM